MDCIHCVRLLCHLHIQIYRMTHIEQCITRTMYCPTCNSHDRPRKGDRFVVYAGTRQDFFVKKAHQDGIKGFTPHIITYFEPFKIEDGLIPILVHCGVCDVHIDPKQNDVYSILFNDGTIYRIPERELLTLILRWKNTGFELI